ncbi:MAG TPA: hypothetical protein VH114_04130 [Candidatus Acidoferrum sp.]|jgi:hypothetical protein|nr:hypothetical protein [Candidatus Acidoferrum sp.]
MEELLAQKIAVEVGRRGRIIGIEQKYLTILNIFQVAAADRLALYSTSTDRALFRAIEELERIQASAQGPSDRRRRRV